MSTTVLIIIIAAIVIAGLVAYSFVQKRRTSNLRSRFGPEYDHAITEYGSRSRAEEALEHRAHRASGYAIRPLTQAEQQRFADEWRLTQARFVDDPRLAIREADYLVSEAMRARGYPMADFDRRAEDLSVDYPHIVRNYRAAHAVAVEEREGHTTTEKLRRAMVYYRDLFDELLDMQASTTRQL